MSPYQYPGGYARDLATADVDRTLPPVRVDLHRPSPRRLRSTPHPALRTLPHALGGIDSLGSIGVAAPRGPREPRRGRGIGPLLPRQQSTIHPPVDKPVDNLQDTP